MASTRAIPLPARSALDRAAAAGAAAVAVGLSALAVVNARAGLVSEADALLLERARSVLAAGRLDVAGFAYPPLPTLAATVLRTPLALGIAGAVLAGLTFLVAWERLADRTSVPLRLWVIAGAICTPAFAFVSTQLFAEMAALLILVVALLGFIRFTVDRETSGGFAAGLLVGAAFFVDFSAMLYGATLTLAALIGGWRSTRREPGSTLAMSLVLAFPVVAAVGSWIYLQWLFTGDGLAGIREWALFPGADRPTLDGAGQGPFGTPLGWLGLALVMVPMYPLVGVLLLRRGHVHSVGYLVPLATVGLIQLAGLRAEPAFTACVLALLAVVAIPSDTTRLERGLLVAATAAQVALAFAFASGIVGTAGERWIAGLTS